MRQKQGLRRNTIDKFYTKKEVANYYASHVKSCIDIDVNDVIIEPSAGSGVFIDSIKKMSNRYIFFDIEPEHPEIVKQDFLLYDYNTLINETIHVIGNPPFGRQSSLAIKFIKRSCKFASSISFILPKSFKKESMRRYFDLKFHLVSEIDVPKNSFLLNSKECDVPCVFQIWSKKLDNRFVPELQVPDRFRFVKKDQNPDISFRRIGVNAGCVSKDINNKSDQSHYFIQFNEQQMNINSIIESLRKVKFDADNTVGPKSISKQEVIKLYNQVL